MARILNWYFAMFVTEPAMRKRVRRELMEARNALMDSNANMELVKSNHAMLSKRVARLTALERSLNTGIVD